MYVTVGNRAACCSAVAEAQQGTRVYRIGYLATASSTSSPELVDTFRDGLREPGWVEGRNIHIVYRYAEGRLDRLPNLAVELVHTKVDVIFAPVPAALAAAANATRTIPIVMVLGPECGSQTSSMLPPR